MLAVRNVRNLALNKVGSETVFKSGNKLPRFRNILQVTTIVSFKFTIYQQHRSNLTICRNCHTSLRFLTTKANLLDF